MQVPPCGILREPRAPQGNIRGSYTSEGPHPPWIGVTLTKRQRGRCRKSLRVRNMNHKLFRQMENMIFEFSLLCSCSAVIFDACLFTFHFLRQALLQAASQHYGSGFQSNQPPRYFHDLSTLETGYANHRTFGYIYTNDIHDLTDLLVSQSALFSVRVAPSI